MGEEYSDYGGGSSRKKKRGKKRKQGKEKKKKKKKKADSDLSEQEFEEEEEKKAPHLLPRKIPLSQPCQQPNKFVNNGALMMLITSMVMLTIRTSQPSSFSNKHSGLESRLRTPRFLCRS